MFKKLALGLLAIVLLVTGGAYLLPQTVHVERSIVVKAAPADVFATLNGYETFNTWSPWHARDPETEYTYSGPASGVGARMAWQSDAPDVGAGSQEITESRPNEYIETDLDFGGDGTATGFFKLVPVDGGTQITWGFDTDLGMNPLARYFGLMFDTWIGADYEAGLANLKTYVESEDGGPQ